MDELITELIADLTTELALTDENFNESVLESKVKSAIREVKKTRNYPGYYSADMVVDDLNDFYSNIRSIALYDYNTVGAEFQKSHNENSVSRTWVDRNTLFSGVIPLAR